MYWFRLDYWNPQSNPGLLIFILSTISIKYITNPLIFLPALSPKSANIAQKTNSIISKSIVHTTHGQNDQQQKTKIH